jgi:hypothetical protein
MQAQQRKEVELYKLMNKMAIEFPVFIITICSDEEFTQLSDDS